MDPGGASLGPRKILSSARQLLAELATRQGDLDSAEAELRQAIDIMRRLVADEPGKPQYRERLADQLIDLGSFLETAKRTEESEAPSRESLSLYEALARDFPTTPSYRSGVGQALNNLAYACIVKGLLDDAEQLLERAVASQEAAIAAHPSNLGLRTHLPVLYRTFGRLRKEQMNFPAAAEAYGRAVELQQGLIRDYPDDGEKRAFLAALARRLGSVLHELEREDEAEAAFALSLKAEEERSARRPERAEYRKALAEALSLEGARRIERAKEADAASAALTSAPACGTRELLERSVVEQEAALRLAAPTPEDRKVLCDHVLGLGKFLLDAGDHAGAEASFRKLLTLLEPLLKDTSASAKVLELEPAARSQLAVALSRLGRAQESEAAYAEAFAAEERLIWKHTEDGSFRNRLGGMLKGLSELRAARGDLAGARECAQQAVTRFEEAVQLEPGFEEYAKDLEEARRSVETLTSK